jgi:hypothetical protein
MSDFAENGFLRYALDPLANLVVGHLAGPHASSSSISPVAMRRSQRLRPPSSP